MTVLQRKELESSPLADLHAIASELGLEGFRSKRKGDLIGAILDAQGGDGEGAGDGAPDTDTEAAAERASDDEASGDVGSDAEASDDDVSDADASDDDAPDETASDETASDEAASDEAASGETASRDDAPDDDASDEAASGETAARDDAPEDDASGEAASGRRSRRGSSRRGSSRRGARKPAADRAESDRVSSEDPYGGFAADEDDHPSERELDVVEEEPEVDDEVSDEEILTGPLDILANGSGFLRLDPAGQSRGDVYVSPAQIRRCELRSGDELSGPVRPPRRNERHPSLIRVETVNGADAEPPEQRPWFGELTAVAPSVPLGELNGVSYARGARVAIVGPAGSGATGLLRDAIKSLGEDVVVEIALAGVRPEEIADWRELGPPVVGGSFDRSPEAQAQAAELAVERAKRQVERGGHAVVAIDSLHGLPPGTRRRVFGAGRATEEGGTLTILAVAGEDREVLHWANAWVLLGD
ncbi:MAG: transcription termination factor Rho [Thermoleophilaceae bacterium]|nr:transcription termination factor Rho [Thermoleophilaceae bacterium]